MEQNCLEQVLEEVIKVEFVLSSRCSFPVPFSVSGIQSMAGISGSGNSQTSNIGTPSLVISAIGDSAATGEFDQAPTLQQKEKMETAGVVVTHTLKVVITNGFADVRSAEESLRGADYNMVLTTADGTRYLVYSLPNTCVTSLDEQAGSNMQQALNVTMESMSHLIKIV